MALLDILDCTMAELIEPVAAAQSARKARNRRRAGPGSAALRPKRARISGTGG